MTGINTGRARRTALLLLWAALALCAIMAIVSFTDDSSADGGDCGTNVHWTYDAGTLTITGTGAMTDWTSADAVPWNAHRGDITNISMANGIATVGSYAFKQCQMTSFVIPDSVTTLGKDCFVGCDKMSALTIGSGVTNFSAEMMRGCTGMYDVYLTGDNYAFEGYSSVVYTTDKKTALYYPAGINIDDIYLADGVERISSYAFMNSRCLVIHLTDSIKVFEDRAFYNSGLHQSVFYFGPNVEYVGSDQWGDNLPDCIYFHLDFKGTVKSDFLNSDKGFYEADGTTKCKDIPKDLLGKQFGASGDAPYIVEFAALSIRYVFPDGSQAADRYYELMGEGLEYTIGSPGIGGYTPDIKEVSGTSHRDLRDITVTYSNKQYEVVYYYNGDEVMRSMEYYGYTVDVKPYDEGHVPVSGWHTVDVEVVDGKFVMPDMGVYFSNIPIGEGGIEKNEGKDDSQKPMEIGLAIAVIAIAATMVLLTLRRH